MILLPLLALAPFQATAQDLPPVKDQVLVTLNGQAQYSYLIDVATDVDDHYHIGPSGEARIYADDAEQARLRGLGFDLRVEIEDVAEYYRERARLDIAANGRGPGGSMGGFKTLAEIEAEMDRLASVYPNLVSSKWSIGTSLQGRTIWAMRVSDNPNTHEPSEPIATIDSIHHAREPMSGEATLLFAEWLADEYGNDENVTRMVNTRNVLLVPCVNPDGYEYNRQTNPNGGGLWRKNRRNNGGGVYGVDLNRNYDWEWGPQWGGSSGSPSSSTYRGTAPFSEPETAVMRDFLAQYPPAVGVSAHSYSNLWLFPWGYDTIFCPDDAILRRYSAKFTENSGWVYGTGWEVLYIANGIADDYWYGAHDTLAWTSEIGSGSDGFWPAPSRILPLFDEVRDGYDWVVRWSGAWAEQTGITWTEVSGDGDASPEPGETWQIQVDFENDGVAALNASLTLSSSVPEITVNTASASANVGAHGNGTSTAMEVAFAANAQSGVPYSLDLQIDYEGHASTEPLMITLGKARVLARDDMESQDFGWSVNNSTNYSWERANPQGTSTSGQTAQPEDDNTPNGTQCWVTGAASGGSVGTNDVDGVTVLTSPIFSLGGHASVELEYARWFANLPGGPLDDVLLVELSNDGGSSWSVLESTGNANSWQTASFLLESVLPLTDEMRLRFTASDSPNNDITEACIDDLELRTFSSLPTLGLWGDPEIGSSVDLFVDGPEGSGYQVGWSFNTQAGSPLSGIDGLLYLAGNIGTVATGSLSAGGQAEFSANVPNDPALVGRTIHMQALCDQGGPEAALSNLLSITITN